MTRLTGRRCGNKRVTGSIHEIRFLFSDLGFSQWRRFSFTNFQEKSHTHTIVLHMTHHLEGFFRANSYLIPILASRSHTAKRQYMCQTRLYRVVREKKNLCRVSLRAASSSFLYTIVQPRSQTTNVSLSYIRETLVGKTLLISCKNDDCSSISRV